jgi:hypothetical protein
MLYIVALFYKAIGSSAVRTLSVMPVSKRHINRLFSIGLVLVGIATFLLGPVVHPDLAAFASGSSQKTEANGLSGISTLDDALQSNGDRIDDILYELASPLKIYAHNFSSPIQEEPNQAGSSSNLSISKKAAKENEWAGMNQLISFQQDANSSHKAPLAFTYDASTRPKSPQLLPGECNHTLPPSSAFSNNFCLRPHASSVAINAP